MQTYHAWLKDEIASARDTLAKLTANPFLTHTDQLRVVAVRAKLTALVDAQIAFLNHRLEQLEANG